ncbi:MAG: M48 family metalloprotease [Cyclobacteriaceae bacterium]|nr:M48 family metalloprotease [Cyclobacteriaceae bacterium]
MVQKDMIDYFLMFLTLAGKGIMYHFVSGLLIGCLGLLLLWAFKGNRPVVRFNIATTFMVLMFASWILSMVLVLKDWPVGESTSGSIRSVLFTADQSEIRHFSQIYQSKDHSIPALMMISAGFIWMSGVFFFSVRILGSYIFLKRSTHKYTKTAPEEWQQMLQNLARQLNIRKKIILLVGTAVQSPFTIGHFKPLIVVPASMLSGMPYEQIEAILIHELWHIRRNDYLINLIITIMVTIMFYHPIVWMFRRVIQKEREHICDDLSIEMGCRPNILAKAMLSLHQLQYLPIAIGFGNQTSDFKMRITRLFERTLPGQGTKRRALLLTGIIFLIIFTAGISIYLKRQGREAEWSSANENLVYPLKTDLASFQESIYERIDLLNFQKSINNTVKKYGEPYLEINGEPVPFHKDFPADLNADSVVYIPEYADSTSQNVKKGLLQIYKKEANENASASGISMNKGNTLENQSDSLRIRQPLEVNNPLVIIDGVIKGKLSDLDLELHARASDIASLNVLKGENAIIKYGENAIEGAIEIYTKNFVGEVEISPDTVKIENRKPEASTLFNASDLPKNVLYFIDEKRYNWYELSYIPSINTEDIISIEVIKDKNRLSHYDADNYEGVIIIRLKNIRNE